MSFNFQTRGLDNGQTKFSFVKDDLNHQSIFTKQIYRICEISFMRIFKKAITTKEERSTRNMNVKGFYLADINGNLMTSKGAIIVLFSLSLLHVFGCKKTLYSFN